MSMIAEIQKFREQTLELIQSQAHGTHNVSLSAVSSSQSEIFQQIRGSLLEISARMATVSAEKQISDLFWFPGLRFRVSSINDAHQGTYRWLLHGPDTDIRVSRNILAAPSAFEYPNTERSWGADENFERHSTNPFYSSHEEYLQRQIWREQFREWLQEKHGLFYISGKPGSGKSTLVKYISQDPLTQELLKAWANKDAKDVIAIPFFFWNSGTKEQKTIAGLYRSVLWEVIQSRPELTRRIFPNLWHKACKDYFTNPISARRLCRLPSKTSSATERFSANINCASSSMD